MSPLTVMLDPADPAAAERHRVALATLPARLRIATEPGADVVAVSGRGPDWPAAAAAALSSGARGVLVARPGPADVDAVRRLHETASGTGAVVAVESPVLDPTWLAAVERLRAAVPAASLMDGLVVTDRDLASALVQQLMLIGSVAGALEDIRGGSAGTTGYWISASVAGTPVNLAGVASPVRPRLTVDVVSGHEQWKACFDPSALARPTSVARYDEHGAELRPEVYESADRAVWRHLAAALTEGVPLPYTLDDLAAHLEPLARVGSPF
jgi:hypothetical protein